MINKSVYACLFLIFVVLGVALFWKIKKQEDYAQKAVLAREIRKVMQVLPMDLIESRRHIVSEFPADGQWHNQILFDNDEVGPLRYVIKDGHLFRVSAGHAVPIADDISALRLRREKQAPDILDVQIEVRRNVKLLFNLRLKMSP